MLTALHKEYAVTMNALCRYKYKLHSKGWKIGKTLICVNFKNPYQKICKNLRFSRIFKILKMCILDLCLQLPMVIIVTIRSSVVCQFQKHKYLKLLCIFHFILICPYGCHLIMLFLSFVYIWLPTKYWMSHHSLPEMKEPKHTSLAKTG